MKEPNKSRRWVPAALLGASLAAPLFGDTPAVLAVPLLLAIALAMTGMDRDAVRQRLPLRQRAR